MSLHEHVLMELNEYLSVCVNNNERAHVLKTIDFIRRTPLAFSRDQAYLGHVGSSAVIVNMDMTKIFLMQHAFLGTWSFFGNHCEGDDIPLTQVAFQRISKEVGEFADTCTTNGQIYDVDVHLVPAHERHNEHVAEHLHYDIAYLFKTEESMLSACEGCVWLPLEIAKEGIVLDDPHYDQMHRNLCKIESGLGS